MSSGTFFSLTLFTLASGCGLCAAGEAPKSPPQLSSHWAEVEAGLGGIQPDGVPKLRYPLCESEELRLLGMHCELVHRVEVDAYGRPRSSWGIAGLQSSLAPHARGTLVWQPLVGPPVRFVSRRIGRALSDAGAANWRIRQGAAGDYEIRALDGRGWRYVSGVLVGAANPALGEVTFVTLGAWVRLVHRTEEALPRALLLEVAYDSSARPISLRVGSGSPDIFHWSEQGYLTSWKRSVGGVVEFSYRGGLLAGIAEPGKAARVFSWDENSGYDRGDTRWAAPVHLAADGESTYDYDITRKGFAIRRREIAGGRETLTIFNPRRRRLEQRVAEKTFIVTFRDDGERMTKLERIENGRGEILEEYRYNEREQLVGIKRRGEPERKLTYDETGRLMALVEIGAP